MVLDLSLQGFALLLSVVRVSRDSNDISLQIIALFRMIGVQSKQCLLIIGQSSIGGNTVL